MNQNEDYIKIKIETNRYLKLADYLIVQSKNKEMNKLGRDFRKLYADKILETESNPVAYEESSSSGSPESYDREMCKSGVCD